MRKSTINIVIAIMVFRGLAFIVYRQWHIQSEYAMLSCLSSVGSEVWKMDATKNLADENENWKILSKEEADFLLS